MYNMNITYSTNAWGRILAHWGATNNVNSAHYMVTGDDDEAVREIAAAGYSGVEMFDGNLLEYEQDAGVLEGILAQNNMSLDAVYCAANFIYEDILEDELYRIQKAASFAKKLGAANLVLGGGATRSSGIRPDDYAKLGKALDKVCDMTEALGVAAHFHPHMGSLVQAPEQLDKVMEYTRIALCPDTGHVLLGGGNPLAVTQKYVDRIRYFHLKDITADRMTCPLGMGNIEFKPILDTIKNCGHEVKLALECDGWNGAPGDGAEISMQYLKGRL